MEFNYSANVEVEEWGLKDSVVLKVGFGPGHVVKRPILENNWGPGRVIKRPCLDVGDLL